MPSIKAVGTAVPQTTLTQEEFKGVLVELVGGRYPRMSRAHLIADHAKVDTRAFAMPIPWYYDDHGHKERNEIFLKVGLDLIEQSVCEALDDAGITPKDVDGAVFVSSTGQGAPSPEALLSNRIGMRPDVMRVPCWGLGCAAGVGGLNIVAEFSRANPDKHYLLIALELTSITFDLDRFIVEMEDGTVDIDKRILVAASIFSDGCAAVVVGPGNGPEIVAGSSHMFPNTERVLGWDIEDKNLEVVLSPDLPKIVKNELGDVVRPFWDQHLGQGRKPEHYFLHPGGASVIDSFGAALDLSKDDLRWTSEVLRRHGNMSSPTALFELQWGMEAGLPAPGEHAFLAGLGPGFTADMTLIKG